MSNLSFTSLGSGSRGNATVIRSESTTLLVDCGFSRRYVQGALLERGINLSRIDAILVTHEHSDHIKGINVLLHEHDVPVYVSRGTSEATQLDAMSLRTIGAGEKFQIGDISVHAVSVPHDSAEPLQFVFSHAQKKVGVLTDCGHISETVLGAYSDCDAMLIECNHDLEMLWQGNYPSFLKQRVASDFGHLNNEQTIEFLRSLHKSKLRKVLIGHISENNNSLATLTRLIQPLIGHMEVSFAPQRGGTAWITA